MSSEITKIDPNNLPAQFFQDKVPLDIHYQIFYHVPLADMRNVFRLSKYFKSIFLPDPSAEEGKEIMKNNGFREFMCRVIVDLTMPIERFYSKMYHHLTSIADEKKLGEFVEFKHVCKAFKDCFPLEKMLAKDSFFYNRTISNNELLDLFLIETSKKINQ